MAPDFSLEGKVAIITGGGTGIGKAIALALAGAGADIIVAARTLERIERTAAEVRALGRRSLAIGTDVTDSAQVNQMVARALAQFGKIDILVNNAGIVHGTKPKAIWEISDDEWRLGLNTNLSGAFFCCRAVGRHMTDRRQGKVVNIASGLGMRGNRDDFLYGPAKAGVILFTKSLAITWAPYGINVNAIAPGIVATEYMLTESNLFKNAARFIPAGRLGDPQEFGAAALFLASEAASYITGEVFVVDGAGMAGGFAPTGYAPVIPLPAR